MLLIMYSIELISMSFVTKAIPIDSECILLEHVGTLLSTDTLLCSQCHQKVWLIISQVMLDGLVFTRAQKFLSKLG